MDQQTDRRRPPSPLEVLLYYYGFPSEPFLVARTGSKAWSFHLPPKAMANIGSSHRLVAIWSTVVEEIIATLRPLDWATIDLLRVGPQGTADGTWPVTLLVAVAPRTRWEDAYPVAVLCKEVLQRHGVHDVECEMREGVQFDCAAADKMFTVEEAKSVGPRQRAFAECVGQSISPCDTPSLQGTLGLYVQVGPAKDVCALTCRHVLFGSTEPAAQLRKTIMTAKTTTTRRHAVAQPGQRTFDEIAARESVFTNKNQPSAFQAMLARQKHPLTRSIGHVHFSPARALDKDKCLHDWAVIKLDDARYAHLSALQNWVWVENAGYYDMYSRAGGARPQEKAQGLIVRLRGVVPKAEIFKTTTTDNDKTTKNHKSLWVHLMSTQRERLFTGISNEVCSVRRLSPESDSDKVIITREWCVVSRNRANTFEVVHGVDSTHGKLSPFSIPGDSGSAVFDSRGRVAGILTAGVGFSQDLENGTDNYFGTCDVSYVTPIETILDALKKEFGSVRIL